ncbi:hypothetical protein [Nocardia sp. NPDC052566]|uniref:hypothetical protein n=1 Tax=Nocardia sp. NPDC052566 TaxID=3364330 RepID=UPI0037C7A476
MTETRYRPTAEGAGGAVDGLRDQVQGNALRHRAEAAQRLPGGDPWVIDLHCDDFRLTGKQLEAWGHAANHIGMDGNTPILPLEVLRALHRRGGADRILAERVYRAGGVAA